MKYFLIFTIALFSVSGFAADDDKHNEMLKMMDSMSFEDAKKMASDKMDDKLDMAEDGKKCVNDSKDRETLKNCMNQMHEENKEMHDKMKHEIKDKKKKK